ncbi:hypothetical protein EVJ58_g5605 [Rhodofomes roseus]|uniref:Uncharacterized protein n=1 Tax=Rhodofomes roseus TaxID=34475 RepID=A0A4Y9YDT6_9APHY|nr:hypothetical protein EVJ58_g5605 [Rhodofomes roseus]
MSNHNEDEYAYYEKAREGYRSQDVRSMPPPSYDDVNRSYINGPYPPPQSGSYTQGGAHASANYAINGDNRSPGPSGVSSGSNPGGMLGMLKNMAPGQSIASLLDPPPPPFLRAPRPDFPYGPFEPAALTSLDAQLDKGFPPLAPPVARMPHPFATHDVADDDWQRFLHDIKIASSLSPINRVAAGVAPMAMNIGLTGFLVSRGIEKRMRAKKSEAIGQLIEQWNAHFFHPRQISVVLAEGSMVYSGPEGAQPPDMAQYSAALARDDHSSSSSSDEDVPQGVSGGRRERRAARRERKEERREERKAEKAARKAQKKNRRELWRLIIAYKPAGGY